MKKQSVTIVGVIVMLLAIVFEKSGVEIGSDKIQIALEVLSATVGLVVTWYGRWRQGDVNIFGQAKAN